MALPISVFVELQSKFCVGPAFANGGELSTLTETVEVAVQPLVPVTVTVYRVIEVIVEIGCAELMLFKPMAGAQL